MSTKLKLWLSKELRKEILNMGLEKAPCETGGMLMGYVGSQGDVVITKLIGPGPNAIHKRSTFVPDHNYQMKKLTEHFEGTDGQDTYLGDWHTHPAGGTALSALDKATVSRIARFVAEHTKHPIMLVAALNGDEIEFGAHRFEKHRYFWLTPSAKTSLMRVVID